MITDLLGDIDENLINTAGYLLDIDLVWQGEGVEEKGIDAKTGKVLIEVDPKYFRPTEVDLLLGDSTKARQKLGWTPKYDLPALVKEMVEEDLKEARDELKESQQELKDLGMSTPDIDKQLALIMSARGNEDEVEESRNNAVAMRHNGNDGR